MQPPTSVHELLATDIERVNIRLTEVFADLPSLPMYSHLAYFMGFKNEALESEVVYGGKRFRSALMSRLADWYGVSKVGLEFAVALELYHNFTLIHDDVVDKDTHRRGRPTVWHLFGHDHAINDGDAQLLLVSEMLAQAVGGNAAAQAAQIFLLQQFRVVVEGQYLDFAMTEASLGDANVTAVAYEDMVRRKTAELIVAATAGIGILAGCESDEQMALAAYGRNLGIAYQICDDVLSIWATSETTGKRNYGDLKERKKTLPILYAHEHLAASERATLEELYTNTELSDEQCQSVIALLEKVDTKTVMEREIETRAAAAKTAARSVSCTPEQIDQLCAIVDSLLPKA